MEEQSKECYRTLRGFLNGEELDEENYFKFSAMLRIHGQDLPLDEITNEMGINPTYQRRNGDRLTPTSPRFSDDAWHFESSIPETQPLELHIDELWKVVQPALAYLKELKKLHKVDVFCGYRSNCDTAGFEVSHNSLELFVALQIPFGVSVIIA